MTTTDQAVAHNGNDKDCRGPEESVKNVHFLVVTLANDLNLEVDFDRTLSCVA